MPLNLSISHIDEDYSIVFLNKAVSIPADSKYFINLSVAPDEISLVIPSKLVTNYSHLVQKEERGWQLFKINQTLDFNLVGVIAQLSSKLAENNISIFVISTYKTDYFLVKQYDIEQARQVLLSIGCEVTTVKQYPFFKET